MLIVLKKQKSDIFPDLADKLVLILLGLVKAVFILVQSTDRKY